MGKEHGNRNVEEKKEDKKGLGADKKGRLIGSPSPDRGNGKGKEKAKEIELAPALEPGDSQDACIEQGIITEEHNMTAATGRHQHRGEKTTDNAGNGE